MAPGTVDLLKDVVGHEHVLTDPDLMAAFGRDWTGRWSAKPLAVVRPGDTAQVSDVVRICSESSVPLVPQGGNTGLVGGSVPSRHGTVVLSTARLTEHGEVDDVSKQVTVGAGMTIADVQGLAAGRGADVRR